MNNECIVRNIIMKNHHLIHVVYLILWSFIAPVQVKAQNNPNSLPIDRGFNNTWMTQKYEHQLSGGVEEAWISNYASGLLADEVNYARAMAMDAPVNMSSKATE